jgi:hypothetical protein
MIIKIHQTSIPIKSALPIFYSFEENECIYTMMELGESDLETYLEQKIQTEKDTAKRFKLIGQLTFLMINALTELHSGMVYVLIKN